MLFYHNTWILNHWAISFLPPYFTQGLLRFLSATFLVLSSPFALDIPMRYIFLRGTRVLWSETQNRMQETYRNSRCFFALLMCGFCISCGPPRIFSFLPFRFSPHLTTVSVCVDLSCQMELNHNNLALWLSLALMLLTYKCFLLLWSFLSNGQFRRNCFIVQPTQEDSTISCFLLGKIIPDEVTPTNNFIYESQNNHPSARDLTHLQLEKRKECLIDRSFYIITTKALWFSKYLCWYQHNTVVSLTLLRYLVWP